MSDDSVVRAMACGLRTISCLAFALTILIGARWDEVQAATDHFNLQSRGDPFVGGYPSEIERLDIFKEVKKDGKVYYQYKAVVKRASGDRNGSLVLYDAPTWGHAIQQLMGVSDSTKRQFDRLFPKSLDKEPFPPVLLKYTYTVTVQSLDDRTRRRISTGSRRAKGANRFVEYFNVGLRPGRAEVRVTTRVELGDHPLKKLWDLYDWASFLRKMLDPYAFAADVAGEYLTKTGLSKKIASGVLDKKLWQTKTHYTLNVPVKVPELIGFRPSNAVKKLRNWTLQYDHEDTKRCAARDINRVIDQDPSPGTWLSRGDEVAIRICRVSGEKNSASRTSTWEPGITYWGGDYTHYEPKSAKACQRSCLGATKCKAWTYVKAGVKGKRAECWLKYKVQNRDSAEGRISGVISPK